MEASWATSSGSLREPVATRRGAEAGVVRLVEVSDRHTRNRSAPGGRFRRGCEEETGALGQRSWRDVPDRPSPAVNSALDQPADVPGRAPGVLVVHPHVRSRGEGDVLSVRRQDPDLLGAGEPTTPAPGDLGEGQVALPTPGGELRHWAHQLHLVAWAVHQVARRATICAPQASTISPASRPLPSVVSAVSSAPAA